jgi:hypothetical protein
VHRCSEQRRKVVTTERSANDRSLLAFIVWLIAEWIAGRLDEAHLDGFRRDRKIVLTSGWHATPIYRADKTDTIRMPERPNPWHGKEELTLLLDDKRVFFWTKKAFVVTYGDGRHDAGKETAQPPMSRKERQPYRGAKHTSFVHDHEDGLALWLGGHFNHYWDDVAVFGAVDEDLIYRAKRGERWAVWRGSNRISTESLFVRILGVAKDSVAWLESDDEQSWALMWERKGDKRTIRANISNTECTYREPARRIFDGTVKFSGCHPEHGPWVVFRGKCGDARITFRDDEPKTYGPFECDGLYHGSLACEWGLPYSVIRDRLKVFVDASSSAVRFDAISHLSEAGGDTPIFLGFANDLWRVIRGSEEEHATPNRITQLVGDVDGNIAWVEEGESRECFLMRSGEQSHELVCELDIDASYRIIGIVDGEVIGVIRVTRVDGTWLERIHLQRAIYAYHDAIEGDPRVVNGKLLYCARDGNKRRVYWGDTKSDAYHHIFSLEVLEREGRIRFGARRGRTFYRVTISLSESDHDHETREERRNVT